MKFDGTHILEFKGQFMWCTETGVRFDRYTRPQNTKGEVAYLDILCPGHRHDTWNNVFTETWTEADEQGAVTVYQTR